MKLLPVLFSLTLTCGIYAQKTQETFDAAVDNWSEGDYLDVLTTFKTILNGTDGQWQTTESKDTTTILDGLKDDSTVYNKAVNQAGFEGWDWAKVTVD